MCDLTIDADLSDPQSLQWPLWFGSWSFQTSVLHMCSLFHAFMFAQLWTIYCEQAAAAPSLQNQNQTEFSSGAILTGLEFWSRVTPSILQLMAHNKVVSALSTHTKTLSSVILMHILNVSNFSKVQDFHLNFTHRWWRWCVSMSSVWWKLCRSATPPYLSRFVTPLAFITI